MPLEQWNDVQGYQELHSRFNCTQVRGRSIAAKCAKKIRSFLSTSTCPESILRVYRGVQNAHFILLSSFHMDLRSLENNRSWENLFSTLFVKKLTLRNNCANGTLVNSLYIYMKLPTEKAQLLKQPTPFWEFPGSSLSHFLLLGRNRGTCVSCERMKKIKSDIELAPVKKLRS